MLAVCRHQELYDFTNSSYHVLNKTQQQLVLLPSNNFKKRTARLFFCVHQPLKKAVWCALRFVTFKPHSVQSGPNGAHPLMKL